MESDRHEPGGEAGQAKSVCTHPPAVNIAAASPGTLMHAEVRRVAVSVTWLGCSNQDQSACGDQAVLRTLLSTYA